MCTPPSRPVWTAAVRYRGGGGGDTKEREIAREGAGRVHLSCVDVPEVLCCALAARLLATPNRWCAGADFGYSWIFGPTACALRCRKCSGMPRAPSLVRGSM